jgi:pimeloyl-ACP methyl ester carboxylesterase
MIEKTSVIDTLELMPFKLDCYGLHPLQAEDRLGNPNIDFPIAMVFGDKDRFGSEGAEEIIKKNKHFKSGRSQLFRVKDCCHNMHLDQPIEMEKLMTGFFEGTIRGRFEPTHLIDQVPLPAKATESKLE